MPPLSDDGLALRHTESCGPRLYRPGRRRIDRAGGQSWGLRWPGPPVAKVNTMAVTGGKRPIEAQHFDVGVAKPRKA
jgi:hypothetical protein